MQLAELNISTWKIDPESQEARGFTDYVARVNGTAERSPGFVWRLLDEQRDENGRNPVCSGPETLMTMSVWESPADLEHFVWNTVHKRIYNGKDQWFAPMDSPLSCGGLRRGMSLLSKKPNNALIIWTQTAIATRPSGGRICRM